MSAEPKHSLGPWEVAGPNHTGYKGIRAGEWIIADVWNDTEELESQADANAALMAAAPEMFDALVLALNELEHWNGWLLRKSEYYRSSPGHVLCEKSIKRIADVIAKAVS